MNTPPVVLTIGGSDSAGCYGVQADLRQLSVLGVHGTCALTVVTAQNTLGVQHASPMSAAFVSEQILAVIEDFAVAAVKTGMLGRVEIIELVAELAGQGRLPNLVVDPVLVNRHGTPVFGPAVADAYVTLLAPRAALLTPNAIEAELLTGRKIQSLHEARLAARELGAPTVITAGRDGEGAENPHATDVLWDGAVLHEITAPRIRTANNAGSGDSFASAVAAMLAQGMDLLGAVTTAKRLVRDALVRAAAWTLGQGPGPLDHCGWNAAAAPGAADLGPT